MELILSYIWYVSILHNVMYIYMSNMANILSQTMHKACQCFTVIKLACDR